MDSDNLEEWFRWLKRLVLDQEKVITSRYMLNHTPLNAMEIQCILNKFLDANEKMHATYYLMVKKGSAKDAPRQCMMVNREDLEQTKNRFDGQITLCNVYSVQKSQVKGFDTLFNLDWNDENPVVIKEYSGKTFIKSATAEKFYEQWKKFAKQTEHTIEEKKSAAVTKQPQKQPDVMEKNEAPQVPSKIRRVEKEKPKAGASKHEQQKKPAPKSSGTQTKISNFFSSK